MQSKPTTHDLTTNFCIGKSYKAISRYFTPQELKFDEEVAEKAFDFLVKEFFPIMTGSQVISNEMAAQECKMEAGAGFPFKFQGVPTKRLFYAHPDIDKVLADDWQACKEDPHYNDRVIYDNLDKEEIRPKIKLEQDAHRSIMNPPADHLHTGQRLFHDMNKRFIRSYLKTSSAVGVSRAHGEWNQLVEKLAYHKRGFAGDESAWDATLSEYLMRICQRLRTLVLPEQRARIENYYNVLIHTLVRMPDGFIFRKRRGNPSGSINTTIDNTILLFFLLAYCWIKNCNGDYLQFKKFVSMVLYGDDNTFTVGEEWIEKFNLKTLGEAMAEFGVLLKNMDDPPQDYTELDFLSCKWKKIGPHWVPYAKDMGALVAGLYYSEYPTDPYMQFEMVLSYHMTNPFDSVFLKIVNQCYEDLFAVMTPNEVYERRVRIPTFDDMVDLYTNREARNGKFNSASVYKNSFLYSDKTHTHQSKHIENSQTMETTLPTTVTPSNTHSRSEINIGRQIIESRDMPEDARNWLICHTDPFADFQTRNNGYPDLHTSGSVVQCINQTFTATAPTGVTNWDCHVFNMQHFETFVSTKLSAEYWNPGSGQFSGYSSGPGYQAAGVQVLTGPAGAQMLPSSGTNVPIPSTVTANGLNPPTGTITSKCRVIGCGIEVINTTAELYKQGSVIAYRMPQSMQINTEFGTTTGSTVSSQGSTTCRIFQMPPAVSSEALILPGSKQWDASEGGYVVCTQMSVDNPIQYIDNIPCFYAYDSNFTGTLIAGIGNLQALTINNTSNFQSMVLMPYNTSGLYFTNLSNSSSLVVNVKWWVESFPGPRDVMSTLTQPSCQYCPLALELYSAIIAKLPVGVPFTMNPNGEWFSDVLGTIGNVAKAGTLIHPAFGLVGEGFGIGKRIYDAIRSNTAKEAKKRDISRQEHPDYNRRTVTYQQVQVPKQVTAKMTNKQIALIRQSIGKTNTNSNAKRPSQPSKGQAVKFKKN